MPDLTLDRAIKIMHHIILHTRDEWVYKYLIERLNDYGHPVPKNILEGSFAPWRRFDENG